MIIVNFGFGFGAGVFFWRAFVSFRRKEVGFSSVYFLFFVKGLVCVLFFIFIVSFVKIELEVINSYFFFLDSEGFYEFLVVMFFSWVYGFLGIFI